MRRLAQESGRQSRAIRRTARRRTAAFAPASFLLNQNAFQAGVLIAPALAIITTVDPLVSIAVAHAWLGETITSTPLAWRARRSR